MAELVFSPGLQPPMPEFLLCHLKGSGVPSALGQHLHTHTLAHRQACACTPWMRSGMPPCTHPALDSSRYLVLGAGDSEALIWIMEKQVESSLFYPGLSPESLIQSSCNVCAYVPRGLSNKVPVHLKCMRAHTCTQPIPVPQWSSLHAHEYRGLVPVKKHVHSRLTGRYAMSRS